MLGNYFTVAWRQLAKNRLYSAINILGLMVGLGIYVFGTLIVAYERSHDLFWANGERIYTVGSVFSPTANIGVGETDGIYTAFTPMIRTEVEDLDAVARTVSREFLVSIDDTHYYEQIRFADKELLEIFDFEYLEGDASALQDPAGALVTRSIKEKLFGQQTALGRTFKLDHDTELHVTAVVADPPRNTHFSSSIMSEGGLSLVAPLEALHRATGYDLQGNFNNLSSGDNTYLLAKPQLAKPALQAAIDGVFDRHFPDRENVIVARLKVRPLVEMNTVIWDAVGLPVMDSVRLLALLVLVVALVNYTNLATAQSLGRSREIGLRKTMGASRGQLIAQFMVESLLVTLVAMLLCVAVLALVVPAFNEALNKSLQLDLLSIAPWLALTTLAVGLAAGVYPAILISRTTPIEALREGSASGAKGSLFRTGMLILQFAISIFMLAMVAVVFLQNKRVESAAEIYPKSQIITLSRLGLESIQARLGTLKNEVQRIPGVQGVTFASQLPYLQSNSGFGVTAELGDADAAFLMSQIGVGEHFFSVFDIPLLSGRYLETSIAGDTVSDAAANVVVNELALLKLGISSAQAALGQQFYDGQSEGTPRAYTIVGVVPDQNFQGFHNQVHPTTFKMAPAQFRFAAIRAETDGLATVRAAVEAVWNDLLDDYPIQSAFLQDEFEETYQAYRSIATILGGFAFVAMSLSLIGLFGLAAFMAATRTREIGIRKVMGASSGQITRLLIWRFSKPVLWALLAALPGAYLAANQFLQFFADRISLVEVIVLIAGLAAVLIAWGVVGIHAGRIARASPIAALRHE